MTDDLGKFLETWTTKTDLRIKRKSEHTYTKKINLISNLKNPQI